MIDWNWNIYSCVFINIGKLFYLDIENTLFELWNLKLSHWYKINLSLLLVFPSTILTQARVNLMIILERFQLYNMVPNRRTELMTFALSARKLKTLRSFTGNAGAFSALQVFRKRSGFQRFKLFTRSGKIKEQIIWHHIIRQNMMKNTLFAPRELLFFDQIRLLKNDF